MKILIEGFAYDPEVVKNALPGNHLFLTNNKVPIENVGYYHNSRAQAGENDDFVFFLPKVVLDKDDRIFVSAANPNGFSPEEIIDPDNVKTNDGRVLSAEQREFLYGFSVWIYQALARYLETHPETDAVWYSHDRQSGSFKRKYVSNTFLDVILAMIRFNRENQGYFLFKIKEKHAGLNKINWSRTIAKSTAIVSNGVPVYLNPINKKHSIDFDEELLVIFYSILQYIHDKYKFRVKIGLGYQLITGDRFKRYLDGFGVARLRQIKYKYFSDRDLALWGLCFAFFEKAHQANIASSGENYLLAKSFDRVFEAMVDELLGDPQLAKYKELEDGKEIDHLYVDDSLTRTDEWRTLCIADSKYYKRGNPLETKSRAKQFTYARDILQLDLDLFLYGTDEPGSAKPLLAVNQSKKQEPFLKEHIGLMRDPETEGYDIIPNFFISATIDEELDYEDDKLRPRYGEREFHSIHFENRLFDRDTLILSHFDVNFLFVLKLYVQDNADARAAWKEEARKRFRNEIRSIISGEYKLHAIMPHDGIDARQFFRENFKDVSGRVYSPYPTPAGKKPIFVLATQDPSNIFDDGRLNQDGKDEQVTRIIRQNEDLKYLIKSAFYIKEDIKWGKDPRQELETEATNHPIVHAPAADSESGVQVVSHTFGPLLAAVRKTGWCPCPAAQCADPDTVKILILPHTQGANLFKVDEDVPNRKSLGENDIKNQEFGNDFLNVVFPSYPVHFWKVCPVH